MVNSPYHRRDSGLARRRNARLGVSPVERDRPAPTIGSGTFGDGVLFATILHPEPTFGIAIVPAAAAGPFSDQCALITGPLRWRVWLRQRRACSRSGSAPR